MIVCLTPYTCFIRNYPVRSTCASHAPRFDSALYDACNGDGDMINVDGTGLERLTANGTFNDDPAWSLP